ncbi:hypothetical protein [Helicobacter ibis]|nr:hypothetical protein [Helicobacter ibis]
MLVLAILYLFGDFDNTYALNVGAKFDMPMIPFMTIGIDAGYTKPKTTILGAETSMKMMSVVATISVIFY